MEVRDAPAGAAGRAIVDAALGAINGGNADAFLSLFAPDGEVDDWGSVYRGRAAIAAWSDRELIGVGARLTLRSARLDPDAPSMEVDAGGGGFNGPSRFTFFLEGGRIRRMRITGE